MHSQSLIIVFVFFTIISLFLAIVIAFEKPDKFDPTEYKLSDQEIKELYIGNNTILIKPYFTELAYSYGYYTYFSDPLNQELKPISLKDESEIDYHYWSSNSAIFLFSDLGIDMITDLNLHENPEIIHSYDSVILLHNEYVTKPMFDSITSHSNVIYLYPNSLYAQVKIEDSQMILVRGHNYPEPQIKNGFDWELDNSPEEYDKECLSWKFNKVSNGHMLNCYPEIPILENRDIIYSIHEILKK